MRTEKDKRVDRERLLYDEAYLQQQQDQYGNAFDIKEAIDTRATVVEIRTAIRYWNGSGMPAYAERWSKTVKRTCETIDDGLWCLEDGEVKYA